MENLNFDVMIVIGLITSILYLKYLASPKAKRRCPKPQLSEPIFNEEIDFFNFKISNFQIGNKTPSIRMRILAIILIIFVAIIPLKQLF